MNGFTHDAPAVLARSTAGVDIFANAVKRVWAWVSGPFRSFTQREFVMRELSSLDDRSLADIGITRSDLRAVAGGHYRRGGLADTKFDPGA